MAIQQWIPKYIAKTFNYKTGQVLTAADYNAILNLLINQSDYNSEWLDWLTTKGIAEFFADLNGDDIKQAIVDAAQEQINGLLSISNNKTSAHLDYPIFTFVDHSATTSALTSFKALLDDHGVPGCLSHYSSLVGSGGDYLSVTDLQAAQVDGFTILNHGVNSADITTDTDLAVTKTSMEQHGMPAGKDILLWTNKTYNKTLMETVGADFDACVGQAKGIIDSDQYDRVWLPTMDLPHSIEDIEKTIVDTINNNKWCIFAVDSSSPDFNAAGLSYAVIKVASSTVAKVVGVPDAYQLVLNTLNNRIAKLIEMITANTETIKTVDAKFEHINKVTYGSTSDGLPTGASEGDIHIMY